MLHVYSSGEIGRLVNEDDIGMSYVREHAASGPA